MMMGDSRGILIPFFSNIKFFFLSWGGNSFIFWEIHWVFKKKSCLEKIRSIFPKPDYFLWGHCSWGSSNLPNKKQPINFPIKNWLSSKFQ
jgi:hypothetical protein